MVGVDKTVYARQDVAEEGPGRVHGLARHIDCIRFADAGPHLLEFLWLVVREDPARSM